MNDLIVDIGKRWLQGWEWIHNQCRIKPGQCCRTICFFVLFFKRWNVEFDVFCTRFSERWSWGLSLFLNDFSCYHQLHSLDFDFKHFKHLKRLQNILNGFTLTWFVLRKVWTVSGRDQLHGKMSLAPQGVNCHWQLYVNVHSPIKW